MSIILNPSEVRVLGALIEKRMTTPDSYPLTLNSLVTACNQSSNRHPVVAYDSHVVNEALINTRQQGLSILVSRSGSRAHKFDERLCEGLHLDERESAVLCELMLRGPQTPGELRQRASRMAPISSLEVMEKTLQQLAERSEPLVTLLPKQPGKREARYAHLLAGAVDYAALDEADESAGSGETKMGLTQRVALLEEQLASVLARLEALEA